LQRRPRATRWARLARATATLLAYVAASSLLACTAETPESAGSDDAVVQLDRSTMPTWDEYLSSAIPTDYAEGRGYTVEWDLWFASEAALRAHYDAMANAQVEKSVSLIQLSTRRDLKRNFPASKNIRYCVSNFFADKARVVREMASATRAWESVANVKFRYVSGSDANCCTSTDCASDPNVDFGVFPRSDPTIRGACATPSTQNWSGSLPFPFSCYVGTNYSSVLTINYDDFDANWAPVTTTGALRHELGHILGLAHEHIYEPNGNNCGEAKSTPSADWGTRQLTSYDQNSVMHYPPNCGPPALHELNITLRDAIGIGLLYGPPVGWLVASRAL
jgi:hypothetical protein